MNVEDAAPMRTCYTAKDLEGLAKAGLVELVEAQFDCWPHHKYKWVPTRDTTMKILRKVLLDPSYGFGKFGESVDEEGSGPAEQDSDSDSDEPTPESEVGASGHNQIEEDDGLSVGLDSSRSSTGAESKGASGSTGTASSEMETRMNTDAVGLQPVSIILVEKRQNVVAPVKTRITLDLEVSGENTMTGTLSVDAKQLTEALQASPAFVEGPARLSVCQHGEDQGQPIYDLFARIDENSQGHCVSYSMKMVSNTVEVHVLDVGPRVFNAQQGIRRVKNQSLPRQKLDRTSERRHIPSQDAPASVGDGDNLSSTENTKDEKAASVIQHLCKATENSSDRSYVAEWRFFQEAKGKTLSDSDTLRAYLFAAGFIERWRDKWVHIPGHGDVRVLVQGHIYPALQRTPGWFVRMSEVVALARQVGPDADHPDPSIISHLRKGEKSGAVGLIKLLKSAVDKRMDVN